MVYSRVFVGAACLIMLWGSAQADAPNQGSALGTLQLSYVDPADVTVAITGPAGFTRDFQVTGGQVVTDLQPGTYELNVNKEGYQNFSETLEVAAGTTTDISVTLEPEASPQAQGEPGILQLTWVDPGGVTVNVSGPDGYTQEANVTGGQIFSGLAAGSYEVAVTKEGFRSTTQEVEVTANGTSSLSVILERQRGQLQSTTEETEEVSETQEAADNTKTAPQLSLEEMLEQGGALYIQAGCSGCHGGDGGGNQGPAFVDNEDLSEADYVANILIEGNGGMPSFGARLSDEEIASLATFIRNSWGNDFGVVNPTDVAAER